MSEVGRLAPPRAQRLSQQCTWPHLSSKLFRALASLLPEAAEPPDTPLLKEAPDWLDVSLMLVIG